MTVFIAAANIDVHTATVQAPMAAGILLFVIPIFEYPFDDDGIFGRSWSNEALVRLYQLSMLPPSL